MWPFPHQANVRYIEVWTYTSAQVGRGSSVSKIVTLKRGLRSSFEVGSSWCSWKAGAGGEERCPEPGQGWLLWAVRTLALRLQSSNAASLCLCLICEKEIISQHPTGKRQGSVSSHSSSSWHCAWPSSAGIVEAGHCRGQARGCVEKLWY